MQTDTTLLPEVTAGEVSGDMMLKASLIAAAATTAMFEPVAQEPITLEEAKGHLRVIGEDEDGYISDLIRAAREMAEGRLNRTIRQRNRTEVFASWCDKLRLPKPPVVSVGSVTYAEAEGAVQTLDEGLYFADTYSEPAVIEIAPGFQAPTLHFRSRPIVVTYLAGYPEGEVPRPIIQWMLLVIGAMYEHRESMTAGSKVEMIPEEFNRWLLQPYMVYE